VTELDFDIYIDEIQGTDDVYCRVEDDIKRDRRKYHGNANQVSRIIREKYGSEKIKHRRK